jgi:hypothetical protein
MYGGKQNKFIIYQINVNLTTDLFMIFTMNYTSMSQEKIFKKLDISLKNVAAKIILNTKGDLYAVCIESE